MQTVFRFVYALVIAILFVLLVILGIRAVYAGPDAPWDRTGFVAPNPPRDARQLYCDVDGTCYLDGIPLTAEDEEALTGDQKRYIRETREYDQRVRDYQNDRTDYRRNVLIVAAALGALAVACGLATLRRVEPMALGLMLGGLGVVVYGWVQAGDEFDEMGATVPFVAVGLGLAAVLAAGWFFLGLREGAPGETPEE